MKFKKAIAAAAAVTVLVTSLGVTPVTADLFAETEENPAAAYAASEGVEISEVNFPDEIFRQYISNYFDTDKNGLLSGEEINCTHIYVSSMGIQSLKGIEYFTALRNLYCRNNQLTSLDVSNNTALTDLNCQNNQLTSLDISNNTALRVLSCSENQLTSLDVSNNTALTDLNCQNNQLTSLDVSNNTALIDLDCQDNQLTSLDVSKNTALTDLYCSENQLTSLDISNNTALRDLSCSENQLTSLDVSNNTALTRLSCLNNQLTSLDISNNTALINLDCSLNQLTSLDISNNTELIWFNCCSNQLTSLDPSNNIALSLLYCAGNQLVSLDISNNTALWNLLCGRNQLTSLDVSNNTMLTQFGCENNQLTSLDVSNNTALTQLWCENNQLTSLDVSNNSLLTEFDWSSNIYNIGETCGAYELKNLPVGFDITKTLNWQGATLEDNKLTEIDGTGTITYDYDCGNNHTATFKLTYNYVEHIYDEGIITIEPTEQTEGEKTYTCINCGETKTEPIEKLETGNTNPSIPSQPTTPTTPTTPTNPTNPTTPQQPATNESDTITSAKNGWGNIVKQINAANDNSKINIDMGNTTNVPKNVLNAIKGKNIDIVLDMGNGITWTINGKDVTNPQSLDFSVTKKKNSIPQNLISDPDNTIPLVLAHNGNFGCSATLSIELGDNNNKKVANLYYYNTKTKELEFVDSCEIVNGKANLVFTHASDWAIVISDISAEYEDVSSAAGVHETDDNSQAPLYMIAVIIAAVGFSSVIIVKRFAKKKC